MYEYTLVAIDYIIYKTALDICYSYCIDFINVKWNIRLWILISLWSADSNVLLT